MAALAYLTPQAADARYRSRYAALSPQAKAAMRRARRHFAPRRRMTVTEWGEAERVMHSGPRARERFEVDYTPALRGILAAYHDPSLEEIWCHKSAQIGWTQGVLLNVIGYHVDLVPCQIIGVFAKDDDAERFSLEKLEPAIKATQVLADKISLEARSKTNTKTYKEFTGGYIRLGGANSPGNIKSADAGLVFVEEPDDTTKNVRGQGDSITIARERLKAAVNGKMLVGGTPTVKGLSKMADGMLATDQRRMFVACPHCGHEQTLRWDQVRWKKDAQVHRPVYGTHRPETARYACEACGIDEDGPGLWTNEDKNAAILDASHRPDFGWRAMAPATGKAGFYLSDLYSTQWGSRLERMVRIHLEAVYALKRGDDSKMRSFKNNQLGECWELKGDAPEIDDLNARSLAYAEWTAPAEALIATCWVDVQRGGAISGEPRLEYLIVGWGRGEESWRLARGVALGNPLEQATWDGLDRQLARPIRSAGGGVLPIAMMGVDAGDGMTMDAVLRYVRAKQREGRNVIATKGSGTRGRPIFSPPKLQDHQQDDRASKWGLKLYLIGTEAAKDAIYGRIKLKGRGAGHMHWYEGIGQDYFEQVTAEVKVPGRNGHEQYEQKAGQANEMLDCEAGNLHLAKRMRLHQFQEGHWLQIESRIRQRDLADIEPATPALPSHVEQPRAAPPAAARRPQPRAPSGDFSI